MSEQHTRRQPVPIDRGGHRERVLAARDALVIEHMRLIPPIVRAIQRRLPPSFDHDDLHAEGVFGLIRAATRYRPAAHGGTPFEAFARPRIRGAILDSVRRRHWEENTREPIPEKLQVAYIDRFRERTHESIDDRLTAQWHKGTKKKLLHAAIGRLTAREKAVLGAFYADNCESIDEAADALGLTPEQTAAEHRGAIAKLRLMLGAEIAVS